MEPVAPSEPEPIEEEEDDEDEEPQPIGNVVLLTLETSPISDDDLYLFNEGSLFRAYERFGSHLGKLDGVKGAFFAVWAPNAEAVSVIGDFNGWNNQSHPLGMRGSSGVWEGFIPGIRKGTTYKYYIASKFNGYRIDKADPYAICAEVPPNSASIVWDNKYTWHDQEWMANRHTFNNLNGPISVYEMHIGSWMRVPEEGNRYLTYRELAEKLPAYIKEMGFTHVEFMPIMSYPFYGSWGYQCTGYFAPTTRFGSPQDLRYLIDQLHQHGIGVLLDWVPSHFAVDGFGLSYFDGSHLYEHSYPEKGWHPDWQSYIFNYGRHEVVSFLVSSAIYWMDQFHADGLRVDAVASMLYLDYSRGEGQWMRNQYGGNENIEAIWFMRRFNEEIYRQFPDTFTVAEESTSWGMVSRPTYVGGLGFGMKWDMGWMHDTLSYMSRDPIHRKYHHHELTFRMLYAFHENFILPLSHDEVVHGKGSLIGKMPGDLWQKFANLRTLYGYMYAQAAKKMIFMGGEFGQWREWINEESLDWHLLQYDFHSGLQRWVADLNQFYRSEPALYELDFDPAGFEWLDCNDWENSTISLLRKGKTTNDVIIIVCNLTPVVRYDYHVGVPCGGFWREVLNSDATEYRGSGQGNFGGVEALPEPLHGRPFSINVVAPPLGIVFFKNTYQPDPEPEEEEDTTQAAPAPAAHG
ncbi:MAG: 1,4-alpha-glucan branching protein GlgB [Chloroflexaceae bacterium]|nr:1,4-alpha-glucan branching protein GlgB [Chloroflexaceae bacterium]